MSPARLETLLWLAQRASAALLALAVAVHLATLTYAVRGGLSAAEILARVRSSEAWIAFYLVFLAAIAVHAALGLRTVLIEWTRLPRAQVDLAAMLAAAVLLFAGLRAVLAVAGLGA